MSIERTIKSWALLVLLTVVTGCASQATVSNKRYFWPMPPDPPRVEWLGTYSQEGDLKSVSLVSSLLQAQDPLALMVPMQLVSDGAGKVYVGDQKIPGVVVFDFNAKKVHPFAEDSRQKITNPAGIAIDGEGRFYVADNDTSSVYVFDKDERQLDAWPLGKLGVKVTGGIALDKTRKHLILPDIRGHRILILDLNGKLIKAFGKRGLDDGDVNYPNAVAVDRQGDIFVCDQMNARIQRFSPEGEFKVKFGDRGDGPGELAVPKGVALDSEGHIYVTDGKSHKVAIYSEKGEFLLEFGAAYSWDGARVVPGGFLTPMGISIDRNDNIFVADSNNGRFQRFQYVTDEYLKKHPYTKEEVAIEPIGGKKGK